MIHISHSRKDMCEIIEVFQIYQVEDYRDKSKKKLALDLWKVLTSMDYVKSDDENFFVEDIDDLRDFLRKPNARQITCNAVRLDVADRVKNIIFYCRECAYLLCASNYDCMDELNADCQFIKNYGDLPSVRRALRLYNLDPKIHQKVQPIMTRREQKREEKKKSLKHQNTLSLKSHKGLFVLDFN